MSQQLQRVERPTAIGYPSSDEWKLMWDMGKTLITSGFLPRAIDRPEKAIAVMLKGRELGWPPMRAFQHINVIDGKPTLSAEAMLALIYEKVPGARINITETSNETCAIEAARPGQEKATRFAFTIEDAQRAGLTTKKGDVWRSYPRAMLRSRCVSEMARALFPDALMGCSYTPEELDAEVNGDGEIIDIAPAPRERVAAPAAAAPPASETPPPEDAPKAKRQAAIYTRDAAQLKLLHDLLAKRDIPSEIWGHIDNELLGKPFTALSTIVPAERAKFDAYVEQRRTAVEAQERATT